MIRKCIECNSEVEQEGTRCQFCGADKPNGNTEDEFIKLESAGCEIANGVKSDCKSYWQQVMDSIPDYVPSNKVETVNHPSHYNQVPGIECIDVVRHFSFNRGNAIKYIWRAGYKGDEIEDLQKAIWYLQDEIERLKEEREIFIQESMDKSFEEYKAVWQELADK